MDFSQAQLAQLNRERIRISQLVEFYFLSGVMRVWRGNYRLTAGGKQWTPTLGLGRISGLSQSYGDAPKMTLSLSGVDRDFAAKARAAPEEWCNRLVFIWEQFFDDTLQPFDAPYCLRWGHMKELTSKKKAMATGYLYTVEVHAETPFDGRANAPYAYLNDTDQGFRHPLPSRDRMLSRAGGLSNRLIKHPQF
jgi:hypothetical protein